MVLSPSARSMKCQLKKRGYSETQIADYLLNNGYLSKEEKVDKPKTPANSNVNNVNSSIQDINEDTYKEYLIRVINNCETDIRICTEIRNYLDKKNILKPSSNDLPVDIDVDHLSQDYRKFKGDLIFGS